MAKIYKFKKRKGNSSNNPAIKKTDSLESQAIELLGQAKFLLMASNNKDCRETLWLLEECQMQISSLMKKKSAVKDMRLV